MPGFFPHTNLQTSAYTPLPKTTADTILTDIVGDVGAGVNGWTLWDDQRTNLTDLYYVPMGFGSPDHVFYYPSNYTYAYWAFMNGQANATGTNQSYVGFYASAYRVMQTYAISGSGNPSGSQITVDGTNFYTVVGLNPGVTNTSPCVITMDRNFAQGSTNVYAIRAKNWGYIVLKCTSAQKTFYVKITRPASYADGLMVKAYETWDNVGHSGTIGGPSEILRTHNTNVGVKGSDTLRYVLWLLPDVFALWLGGDPLNGNPAGKLSDFMYIGNMSPYRAGDTDCLIQACSNQEYSGVCATAGTTLPSGGAACLRGLSGQTWVDPTLTPANSTTYQGQAFILGGYTGGPRYAIWPKDSIWINNPWRGSFDNFGRFQISDVEAYSAEACSNGSGNPQGNEGKRGDLKYLKYPSFNPSGFHLVQFGPADDGNTYVVVKVDFPIMTFTTPYTSYYRPTAPGGANVAGGLPVQSGWAFGNKVYTSGEIGNGGGALLFVPNYFLMPTNI